MLWHVPVQPLLYRRADEKLLTWPCNALPVAASSVLLPQREVTLPSAAPA